MGHSSTHRSEDSPRLLNLVRKLVRRGKICSPLAEAVARIGCRDWMDVNCSSSRAGRVLVMDHFGHFAFNLRAQRISGSSLRGPQRGALHQRGLPQRLPGTLGTWRPGQGGAGAGRWWQNALFIILIILSQKSWHSGFAWSIAVSHGHFDTEINKTKKKDSPQTCPNEHSMAIW